MGKHSTGDAAKIRATNEEISAVLNLVRPSTPEPPEKLPAAVIRELERVHGSGTPKKKK